MAARGQQPLFLLLAVLLLGSSHSVLAQRSLLQSEAVSNSNGCLGVIPKCEAGACAARNIMGAARWVCLRCLANYEPVVDNSGQDNIIQCVCPRGFYEPAANATRCLRCDANSFCPGGDKVESPSNRGSRVECGTNLITRNTGARTQADCVAPAGFAQTTPNMATPCSRSEYAPQYNRLAKCLRCQSGLEEPPASGLAASARANKKTVCKVPPGRFMSQGLVRWCPQGFYRANYTDFDQAVSQICLACKPGITTQGSGARSAAECDRVLPGHGIQTLAALSASETLPTLPVSNEGLPAAAVCAIGYYSAGGFCVQCPSGAVTASAGAKSIEECVVPPGYFIQSANAAPTAMAQCGPGLYRERWVMFADPRALNCTACGQGIQSEPRDLDENPLAVNGSLVRATSTSCYIEAGQGMIASGRNIFAAYDCPANSYGVTGKIFGLGAAPCKPCPRNMITDGLTRVNNSDACVNDDGFGYASEGASRCSPGFYSLKGSRKPCQQCPFGRTTANDASRQRLFTDCYVKPGFGLVSSTGESTDHTGFIADASSVADDVAAVMTVLECPIGYYGAGLSIRSTCVPCPVGSTTEELGRTAVSQCSVCIAGYGQQGVSTDCTPCDYGSYHPGGGIRCTQCPAARFYAPVDGAGDIWESQGTTLFKGAFGIEFCVPRESQLSPDAGQIYFNSAVLPAVTLSVPKPTLAACIATCPPENGCMVQFDAARGTCYYAALPWDPSGPTSPAGTKLLYKLPPSTLTSASSVQQPEQQQQQQADNSVVASAALMSVNPAAQVPDSGLRSLKSDNSNAQVRAKMMASGFYARCAISTQQREHWLNAGVPLEPERAQNFRWGQSAVGLWDTGKSEAACQRKCDDSIVCWGFLYDTTSQSCLYRGGEDALRSRSFFVMPNMATVGNGTVISAPSNTSSPTPVPSTPPPSTPPTPAPTPSTPPPVVNGSALPVVNASSVPSGGVIPNGTAGAIFTNGTTVGSEQEECFNRCQKNQCCAVQYNSVTKTCSLCDMECDFPNADLINPQTNGNQFGDGYRITYKRADNPRASSVGQANNAQQYHRCKLHTQEQVDAYILVGFNLDPSTAQQRINGAPQWRSNAQNEQECREVCTASSVMCWGFLYHPRLNICLFKGGSDSDFSGVASPFRTFLL